MAESMTCDTLTSPNCHSCDSQTPPAFENNKGDMADNIDMVEDNEFGAGDDFDDDLEPTLDNLPPELFLTICSYLPASFILTVLTRVCRDFRDLLMDDSTWKIRISKRCQKLYPRVPDDDFQWKLACIKREDTSRQWTNMDKYMESFSLVKDVHSNVDCVHLMDHGQLLASGSRDRHLTIWDLKKLNGLNPECEDEVRILTKTNAHKGWIWDISSRDHFLATAAWDSSIKLWDLGPGCEEIRQVKCKSAVLCLDYVNQTIVAGGYDKYTYMIDSRTGNITSRLRHHKRSVLCLSAQEDYIITGSEDNTICVYDQKAGKVLKTITLANYPMSLTRDRNQVLVGDKMGLLHLIDANQSKFDIVKSYDIGHEGRITAIKHGYGCTVTSSVDKTIRIMEPCDNPSTLRKLDLHTREVAGIAYMNGTLVSAGSDCVIGVWRPKSNISY